MTGGYGAGEIARLGVQGLVVLTVAFAIRVGAAALAYRDGALPGGLYHLTLTVMVAVGTSAIVGLAWLASKANAPTWAALLVLLGAASMLLAAALRLFHSCVGPADTRRSDAARARCVALVDRRDSRGRRAASRPGLV